MPESTEKQLYDKLLVAGKMVDAFEQKVGRAMTENDRSLAITLFIEEKKHGKPGPVEAAAQAVRQSRADVVPACPKCGGPMWDNRETKKKPTHPDFRCKDKTCVDEKGYQTSAWVEKSGPRPRQATGARVPSDPFSHDDETDLPF